MALTQSQMELELDQHSEDILSLYELVERVRVELTARLDAHDARFDGIDARFDGIDARLGAHDARFDRIDDTLAEVLRRLPA